MWDDHAFDLVVWGCDPFKTLVSLWQQRYEPSLCGIVPRLAL